MQAALSISNECELQEHCNYEVQPNGFEVEEGKRRLAGKAVSGPFHRLCFPATTSLMSASSDCSFAVLTAARLQSAGSAAEEQGWEPGRCAQAIMHLAKWGGGRDRGLLRYVGTGTPQTKKYRRAPLAALGEQQQSAGGWSEWTVLEAAWEGGARQPARRREPGGAGWRDGARGAMPQPQGRALDAGWPAGGGGAGRERRKRSW